MQSEGSRWLLLASMGIPLACGGEVRRNLDQGASTTRAAAGVGGAVGVGGVGGTGGAGGAAGATGFSCSEPCELELGGVPAGIYWCEEGYEARQEQVTCPNLLPPKDEGELPPFEHCSSHAECPGLEFCQFQSAADECQTDADCGDPDLGNWCTFVDGVRRCRIRRPCF